MDRRTFLKAITAAAATVGLGELSDRGEIRTRNEDLIIVPVSVTWTWMVFQKDLDEALQRVVERVVAAAEIRAKQSNWYQWKKRMVYNRLPDMDMDRYEIVLERIA